MILVVLLLAFLFYRSSLSYYFISDDFIALFYHLSHPNILQIDWLNNHYTPVIWYIIWGIQKIYGFNPAIFHLIVIMIHLLNCYLVYRLAASFTKNKIKSILASLLFAFFFGAYEVVYWIGAINNSLMVTFYLGGLLSLMQYVRNKRTVPLVLFQLSFIAAYFTHEYALSLIPTAIAYWWLFCHNKKLKDFLILFSIPTFIVISTTILKAFMVIAPLTVRTPSLFKFIAFMMRSFVYLFIPNPYGVDKLPNVLIPLLFFIIVVFLFKFTKNKQAVFLLIWTTLTICVYSLTSAPQARYFYLSFIPVIIYIVSLAKLRKATLVLYLSFILVSGVLFLQYQKQYWVSNSTITKNVIKSLKRYAPKLPKTEVLYFVNLPDSSNDSLWKAYVFRAGFPDLLRNVVGVNPKKIVFLRSYAPTSHTMEAPYISPEKLKVLAKSNGVFVYTENLKDIILLK